MIVYLEENLRSKVITSWLHVYILLVQHLLASLH